METSKDKSKTVLVVGGMGFIGHQVTRILIDGHHDVHVMDSCTRYTASTESETCYQERLEKRHLAVRGATLHTTDILDAANVSKVIREVAPQTIIHLASIPVAGIALRDPRGTTAPMVTGTANLLEAARENRTSRFVYVSSSMVYGDFETTPAPETHPTNCRDIYGNLKLASERLAQAYHSLHDMDCVTVRPMAVYGPTGNEEFVITKFVRAAIDGRPLIINGEDTCLDLTFVDDTAQGIVPAATHCHCTQCPPPDATRRTRLSGELDIVIKILPDAPHRARTRQSLPTRRPRHEVVDHRPRIDPVDQHLPHRSTDGKIDIEGLRTFQNALERGDTFNHAFL